MTFEVDTQHGLKTGSSVLEVTGIGGTELITGDKTLPADLRGEAVMVDLGYGRVLFALLRMANGTSLDDHLAIMSMKAMAPAFPNNKKDSAQRIASGSGITSPAGVAPKDYPPGSVTPLPDPLVTAAH